MTKIQSYTFPVVLDATTTAFFTRAQAVQPASVAAAMKALVANPKDATAAAFLSKDALLNSTLRTTCVVTLIGGGHAENALPQRATANVNCRIFPTETVEATQAKLAEVIGDKGVSILMKTRRGPPSKPTPLDPAVLGPAEAVAKSMYPGLPIIPLMSTGASDSIFLAAAGIPSYGVPRHPVRSRLGRHPRAERAHPGQVGVRWARFSPRADPALCGDEIAISARHPRLRGMTRSRVGS